MSVGLDGPVRQLIPSGRSGELSDADLVRLHITRAPFVRLNIVATVDGAAAGPDGRSGSINTAADHRVFEVLRAWADVVLIGRGTYDAEGYGPLRVRPDLAASRTSARQHPALAVLTSTPLPAQSEAVFAVHGDLPSVIRSLDDRGLRRVLCEGGPTLAAAMFAAGLVDELCVTTSPMTLGGNAIRVLGETATVVDLRLVALLEQDSTLLARWVPQRS